MKDDHLCVENLTIAGLLETLNRSGTLFSRLEVTVDDRREASVYATCDPQLMGKIDALIEEYEALQEKGHTASIDN